ncbi:MAG TPA: DUF2452 domain-containing protein [Flavobacteriales bacterium]|nr:DUF2452 domain-containing protein [Flavobacteriales bacterium]|tara:strand:+ start:78849 stop:79283 length:435 start_codon:yes stop_codon:yes gene_type:complete
MSEKEFTNPIDKDKITETPSTLPYAHHVGSAIIKPEDKGRIKGRAMAAMVEQTNSQMQQIYEQMQLLAQQAKKLEQRVLVSEKIYNAEMNFQPVIGHTYYLYRRKNGKQVLSMVAPENWGKTIPFEAFEAKVKLLADHTWEVLD